MLDKNVYLNLDSCKISVRQAGGSLQLSDLTVTGRDIKIANKHLDKGLGEVLGTIAKWNKEIAKVYEEEKNQIKEKITPKKKKEKDNIEDKKRIKTD